MTIATDHPTPAWWERVLGYFGAVLGIIAAIVVWPLWFVGRMLCGAGIVLGYMAVVVLGLLVLGAVALVTLAVLKWAWLTVFGG